MSARLPRRAFLATLGATTLLLAGCGTERVIHDQPSMYHDLSRPGRTLYRNAAVSMINGYRANNGLGPVTRDPRLDAMAEEQARAMAAKDSLDHRASGRDFAARMNASGYKAASGVENVSAGYMTLAEAFSGWRDSPPHKANMLKRDAQHMGIAAVHVPGTKYRVFWALVMATPDK